MKHLQQVQAGSGRNVDCLTCCAIRLIHATHKRKTQLLLSDTVHRVPRYVCMPLLQNCSAETPTCAANKEFSACIV